MITKSARLILNKKLRRNFNSGSLLKYKLPIKPTWSIKDLNLENELNEEDKINKVQLEKWYKLSNLKYPRDIQEQDKMMKGCEELIKLVGNVKELDLRGVESLSRLEIVKELDLNLDGVEEESPLEKDSEWALSQSPIRRENYFITKSVQ